MFDRQFCAKISAFLLWLCVGFAALGITPQASAVPIPAWHIHSTFTNLNGTTTMLWIKAGTYDNSGNYSGDTASIWTLDAMGNQKVVSPNYGPYTGWRVSEIDPNYDGSLLMGWVNVTSGSSSTVQELFSLWKLDATGSSRVVSSTYGPYAGWTVQGIAPQANGTTLVGWIKGGTYSGSTYSGDAISLWVMDPAGNRTIVSPTYGPYPGWQYREGIPSFYHRDGSNFLLLVQKGTTPSGGTYSGDQASIWKVDEFGNRTSVSTTYGPYVGWRVTELTPAYDGSARLSWVNTGTATAGGLQDQVSLWLVDISGNQTSVSPTYGPYPGWSPASLHVAPDNTSRLLWVKRGTTDSNGVYSGDQTSLWSLNAAGHQTFIGPTYGPTPGWKATYGFTLDGSEKFLWEHTDPNDTSYAPSQFYLWGLSSSGTETSSGPTYGPYY